MAIIIWLISLVISMLILHWIITGAINSSGLARDIKEIKEILKNQVTKQSKEDTINLEITDEAAVREACPTCGNQVLSTDKFCSSCGSTLI